MALPLHEPVPPDPPVPWAAPVLLHASAAPASTGGRWFGAAAAGLLLGLLIGFVSGFIVAQQTEPIATPRFAAEPRVAPPADTPEPSRAPTAAAPAPQTFTESPVVEPPAATAEPSAPAAVVDETPVIIEAPKASAAATTRAERARTEASRPARAARSAPVERATARIGSLDIASRPPGAQVYLDDVRVGTTPLMLGAVNEGRHRVRLELPGYRSWATSVDVPGNDRTRIGASLER